MSHYTSADFFVFLLAGAAVDLFRIYYAKHLPTQPTSNVSSPVDTRILFDEQERQLVAVVEVEVHFFATK